MGVAETAAATLRSEPAFAVLRKVLEKLPRRGIVDLRPNRNPHNFLLAVAAGAIRPFAVASSFSDVFRIVTKVKQRIERLIGFDKNVAAPSAVSSGRPSARNEFFAPKSRHAVSAVPSLNTNFGAIYKHF